MTIHDPATRIRAAALLRGDLCELLPQEAAGEVDARLHGAIVLAVTDPESAAAVITAITATGHSPDASRFVRAGPDGR